VSSRAIFCAVEIETNGFEVLWNVYGQDETTVMIQFAEAVERAFGGANVRWIRRGTLMLVESAKVVAVPLLRRGVIGLRAARKLDPEARLGSEVWVAASTRESAECERAAEEVCRCIRALLPPNAPFEVAAEGVEWCRFSITGVRGTRLDPEAFASHAEECAIELVDEGTKLSTPLSNLVNTIERAAYAIGNAYNGGVSQLLYNAHGADRDLDSLIEALETIGATKAAQALRDGHRILHELGPETLLDGDYFDEDKRDSRDAMDELSSVFYSGSPSARSVLSEWLYAQRGSPAVAELLADFGPLPAPEPTRVVLEQAVRESNLDAVRRVLDDGFDPDTPDLWNRTVLVELADASKSSDSDVSIVEALHAAGADPWRCSREGRCVLHVPRFRRALVAAGLDLRGRLHELAGPFRSADELEAAYEDGVPLDASRLSEKSFDVGINSPESARALVETLERVGLAVDGLDASVWRFAMHQADVLEVVRGAGANVIGEDEQVSGGWSHLHQAACHYPGVLEQLLEDGADVSATTDIARWQLRESGDDREYAWVVAGATPLDVAHWASNQRIIELLESHSAPRGAPGRHCVGLMVRGSQDRPLLEILGDVDRDKLCRVGRAETDEWLASPMVVATGLSRSEALAWVERLESVGAQAEVV